MSVPAVTVDGTTTEATRSTDSSGAVADVLLPALNGSGVAALTEAATVTGDGAATETA